MIEQHIITKENYQDAQDALRDVLMLYVDMAEHYSGFGHASDLHVRFDRLKYIDAELQHYHGYAPLIDVQLLRTGAAIAVLCSLYDDWCEEQSIFRFKEAIEAGRLRFVPDVEAVAIEAIKRGPLPLENPWFDDAVEPIYQTHVIGYFERLAKMHRREGGDNPFAQG